MPTILSREVHGRDSSFEIVRHKLSRNFGYSYIELLEVVNPQNIRPKYILHLYEASGSANSGHHSWSFASLEAAKLAWWQYFDGWTTLMQPLHSMFMKNAGYDGYEYQPLPMPWYYK